jgi:hypothetical protein
MGEPIIVICPHCLCEIIIAEVNCQIFRHAVYKITGDQMSPHASKEECDKASMNHEIYGCGKPFRIDIIDNKWVATSCDYI